MCALKKGYLWKKTSPQHTQGSTLRVSPAVCPFPWLKHPMAGWDPTGRAGLSQDEKLKGTEHSPPGSDFIVHLKNAAGTRTRKSSNVDVRTGDGSEVWSDTGAARRDLPCRTPRAAQMQKSCSKRERHIPLQLQLPFLSSYFSWTCSWLPFDVSSWENIFIKHNKTEKSLWESLSAQWFWLVLMFFWLAVKMHLTLIDWAL